MRAASRAAAIFLLGLLALALFALLPKIGMLGTGPGWPALAIVLAFLIPKAVEAAAGYIDRRGDSQ